MGIQLFDPVGIPEAVQRPRKDRLPSLAGLKVGYIFNQHTSAQTFWGALEKAITATFEPASVHRIYKTNTWAPAPGAEVDQLIAQSDYALVGVGA